MTGPGSPRRWLAAGAGLLLIAALIVGLRTREEAPQQPANEIDARIEFYRARLGGPGTYPAYARLGLAHLDKARETGDSAHRRQAAIYLLKSNDLQPNYEALRGLTALELARHRFPEARQYAEEALKAHPGDIEAQTALFDVLLAQGETLKAAKLLDQILKEPESFAGFTRLANLREVQGNHRGALNAIGRACSLAEKEGAPAVSRAWCQVRTGSIYVGLCDGVQAGHAYRRALALVPEYFLAREHLAELYAVQDQTAEAIEIYEDLLQTNPGPQYRLALADLLTGPEQTERAARLRDQALTELRISAESESREDWRPLALLLLESESTVEEGVHWAEQDWKNRKDAFAADTLAWARFRRGRIREAARLSEQAVGMEGPEGKSPVFLLHGVEIQLALRQREKARALLDQAAACPLRLFPWEQATADRLHPALRQSQGRNNQ